jgi:cytochrome b6-f complex iron-sulfur subunit
VEATDALDRRAFLDHAARGAAGLAVLAACGGAAGCVVLNPNARLLEAERSGSRVALGRLADLPVGGELKVVAPGLPGPVLVARVGEDEVRAVAIRCTHRGSELALAPGERRFRCVAHGSQFAFDGTVLRGPAANPVASYEVAHEEGQLYLLVP